MTEYLKTHQYTVDSHVEEALYRAFEHIWDDINTEKYTFSDAKRALEKNWDLGDFFQEWFNEGEE